MAIESNEIPAAIESNEIPAAIENTKAGRPPLYPWQQWFSSTQWPIVLVAGRDYHCSTYIMSRQVSSAGRKYGVKVSVRTAADSLSITVHKLEGETDGI